MRDWSTDDCHGLLTWTTFTRWQLSMLLSARSFKHRLCNLLWTISDMLYKNFVCVKYSFFSVLSWSTYFQLIIDFFAVFRSWFKNHDSTSSRPHRFGFSWTFVTDCAFAFYEGSPWQIENHVDSRIYWGLVIYFILKCRLHTDSLVKSAFSTTVGILCSCCLCLAFSVLLQSECWYVEQRFVLWCSDGHHKCKVWSGGDQRN